MGYLISEAAKIKEQISKAPNFIEPLLTCKRISF